jgi:RNA polymerase primary sigma factor
MSPVRLKPLVRAAVQNGNLALVADDLTKGGEINAQDNRGQTPLMLAASRGHTSLCRLLLENGADISQQDDEGRAALEIARVEGRQEVVLLIESYLHQPSQDTIEVEPGFAVPGLFEVWEPEIEVEAPVEDVLIRFQVLNSQAIMQASPPVNHDADWGDLVIELPEVDGLAIGREFQRDEIQELFRALIGEARQRGAFRPSLAATLAVELDGSVDGDLFQNISQMLGDIGCVPEEDEEAWGHGCPLGEEWDSDDFTEDCLRYLRDLQFLTNDPYDHLSKEVQLSILLDREGEERIGRRISVAMLEACDAIASDDRVLTIFMNLATQVETDFFLAGRLSRLDAFTEEDTSDLVGEVGSEELEASGPTLGVSRFRSCLAEAISAYRDTSQSGRIRRIAGAIRKLELTPLGFRTIKKALASAGAMNEHLDDALERVTRLESEMFSANVRLAISVARKYSWSKLPGMDLIQEAYIGLLKAIEKFDYERGIKFSTYATWWLKQSVLRAIADKERTIRVPVHMLEKVNKLASAARDKGVETAREMPASQLAALTGLSEAEVRKALSVVEEPTLWEGSPEALAVVMSLADGEESPPAFAERLEMESILLECVDQLSEREAAVIKHRFGLMDGREKTLEQVGQIFGVVRERIRQIEAKALEKLRKRGSRIAMLEDYVRSCG